MGELEVALRARRDAGGRAFVPYVTGGLPGVDAGLLRAIEDAGADAIEVGIPFSDPVMDGGVIQEASRLALEAGAHPPDVLATIRDAALAIPVAVMTYVNPVYRRGIDRFLDEAVAAGVAGIIVPDLPVDEAGPLDDAAATRGIDAVLLAAPGTAPARLAAIAERAHGFVYCVATYGVTGARESLADDRPRPRDRPASPHRPPAPGGRGDRHARTGRRRLRVRRRGDRRQRPDGASGRGRP